MDASPVASMEELNEEKNKRLKDIYAEKNTQNALMKDALGKHWGARLNTRDRRQGATLSIHRRSFGTPSIQVPRDIPAIQT